MARNAARKTAPRGLFKVQTKNFKHNKSVIKDTKKCKLVPENNYKHHPRHAAFTLAELLTAVLVISVIMVALAPVITKRMKDNVSVTTDNKKGLEIFTNPGTYTFDVPIGINTLFLQGSGGGGGGAGSTYVEKEKSFTSSATWIVPTGVNEITLTITGAGGGGGGANGAATPSVNEKNNAVYNNKCLSDEFLAIRGSENEADLCITRANITNRESDTWWGEYVYKDYEGCTIDVCCWENSTMMACSNTPTSNGALMGCKRPVCTFYGADDLCVRYKTGLDDLKQVYRLPNEYELEKIRRYLMDWSTNKGTDGLNLCSFYYLQSYGGFPNTSFCASVGGACKGAFNDTCQSNMVWGQARDTGAPILLDFSQAPASSWVNTDAAISSKNAYSTRCVRSLNRYTRYSASGGSSGAVLEKTINVLPNDTFEITIGQGGAGGASKTKGSQGGTTKIVHKRKNIELGTYYVKGGLGGNPATTSAHGKAYTNGTASNNTTPSGTCYSRNRKDTTDSFTGGNTSCTTISYSGESGSSTKGGNGGRVKNTGTINNGEASSGGYLYVDSSRTANQRATNEEIRLAKGQNASTPGFGGGGGLTPAWANSTSHFYQGGKGASGKVEITYKVALPGGGGGSSARVAGVDNNNKAYEIIYKVSEGDRIVFKVGSGGSGGIENQDGLNGSATVVGDNDIVFLAGEGGKTATDTDKNNLKGGRGGYTSYINEEDNIQSNIQTGIKLKSKTPPITYTINPPNNSFKGQNGTRGGVPEADTIQSGYTITNTIFSYGFNGGMGASPFNVEKSKTAASISCGGGIQGTLGQTTNLKYLCTSGNTKGNDARNHDPVNNEFGGSGGGGGGVKDDSFEQGTGGNGSSGYLRIRWDASEQE